MNGKKIFVDPPSATNTPSSSEGGYVKGVVTYMVMDDLEVKPMSTISGITLISKLVKEVGALEEKVVDLDMDEVCHHSFAFYACLLVISSFTFRSFFLVEIIAK